MAAEGAGLLSNHSGGYYRSLQMMTSFIHLFGCSVLCFLISRRTPIKSFKQSELKAVTWGKMCMFMVLIDSWLFVLLSGFLLTGVGTSYDSTICSVASFICIFFQGSSKVLIYAFLVEKVYIVWSGGFRTPRLKTRVYQICLVVQLGYVAIDVLFLVGRWTAIMGDGACVIGFKRFVSIPLVVYDFIQNLFFTFMFLWPLYKQRLMNPGLRLVAKRTFIGAISGLTLFASNTIVLIAMGGHELDWVCMTSCVLDVTLNALILYWVSSGAPSDSVTHFSMPSMTLTTGSAWGVETRPTSNGRATHTISLSTMQTSRRQGQNVTFDLEHQTHSGSDMTKSTGKSTLSSFGPIREEEYDERKADPRQTQSACLPRRRYSLS